MAAWSSIRPSPAVLALSLLMPVGLGGCGYTLERTSQIEAREQALAAAERQIRDLEGTLRAERRAARDAQEAERRTADDLAALQRRLRAARVQVAALERSRVSNVATDAPTAVLGEGGNETPEQRLAASEQRAADEEARRQALQDEAEWTQRTLAERQQMMAGVEHRLQELRGELAAAETAIADRRRELADLLANLREQIARERAAAPPPTGTGPQPEGGGPPR